MPNPTVVIVFAIPGREPVTVNTIRELDTRGGGSTLDCERFLFWTGLTPPPDVPSGWLVYWNQHGRRGSEAALADFVHVLELVGDRDLVFIEDDVSPCRNALAYMVAWAYPHVTHFFNGSRKPHGPRMLPPGGFEFSQALKIPAAVVAKLRANPPTSRGPNDGWDLAIGRCVYAMGQPLYQHRSLVQHVGFDSMWNPSSHLAKQLPAQDFPGVDFDAMEVPR